VCVCVSVVYIFFHCLPSPAAAAHADALHSVKHKILPTPRPPVPRINPIILYLYIYYINGDLDNPFCTRPMMTKSSSSSHYIYIYILGVIISFFPVLFSHYVFVPFELLPATGIGPRCRVFPQDYEFIDRSQISTLR